MEEPLQGSREEWPWKHFVHFSKSPATFICFIYWDFFRIFHLKREFQCCISEDCIWLQVTETLLIKFWLCKALLLCTHMWTTPGQSRTDVAAEQCPQTPKIPFCSTVLSSWAQLSTLISMYRVQARTELGGHEGGEYSSSWAFAPFIRKGSPPTQTSPHVYTPSTGSYAYWPRAITLPRWVETSHMSPSVCGISSNSPFLLFLRSEHWDQKRHITHLKNAGIWRQWQCFLLLDSESGVDYVWPVLA